MPHSYLCGDNARRDEDGYYWIMGRIDDVLNVSGHRLSTIEIESALVSHDAVAEAAAVGRPHELKGEAVAVFVTLAAGFEPSEELRQELKDHVRKEIGALAVPDDIRFTASLPKTRSGKIMRRLLARHRRRARDRRRHDDAGGFQRLGAVAAAGGVRTTKKAFDTACKIGIQFSFPRSSVVAIFLSKVRFSLVHASGWEKAATKLAALDIVRHLTSPPRPPKISVARLRNTPPGAPGLRRLPPET